MRPIKRREQGRKNVKKQKKRNLGDTMPMRPVREDVYDTAPMRPMNIRSGYEGYRRTIDRRREVIRTERPVSGRVNSRKGKKERTSGRTRYETEIVYRR